MSSHQTVSSNKIRRLFTVALSTMYQREVPDYDHLLERVEEINSTALERNPVLHLGVTKNDWQFERHGAIRLGTAYELFTMRRLFAVMGMSPVDYYDLSASGIPVHSTAFRATQADDLRVSPFRMFTSLLRLDLIENKSLRENARKLLSNRQVFSSELLSLIDLSEEQGGLTREQLAQFIANTLEVFRWHHQARVTKQEYEVLKKAHGLIADIVSFKGPHINHLTPRTLDIEEAQIQLSKQGFKSKQSIEGPPLRKCPVLLRQTSFLALEESIRFIDGNTGNHTARFGEIEQRGVALTPKGRDLYDHLLHQAKTRTNQQLTYSTALAEAFLDFPDSHKELHEQGLAYYSYSVNPNLGFDLNGRSNKISEALLIDPKQLVNDGVLVISPILYEDFLPVSAAGIFTSNLASTGSPIESCHPKKIQPKQNNTGQTLFEEALGASVIDSFSLYKKQQEVSLKVVVTDLSHTPRQ